jgi:hypothetical protein
MGFVVVSEMSMLLDHVHSQSHMHEKGFLCTIVPDGEMEVCAFSDMGLEMLILESRNRLLNWILLWYIEDRWMFE